MLATFAGTSGNDTIAISVQIGGGMTIVQINGVSNLTADTDITVNAGNGDDLFRVFNTKVGVLTRLRGEGGNDTCENPNTLDLDAVYNGPTFFFGGTGFDVYFADNRNDTTGASSIDITRTAITRGTDGAISLFDEIEHLEYRDNNSGNRISFSNIQDSTREITTIAINANGGNDTITNIDSALAFGHWSTAMGSGGAFLDGGAGTDTLQVNNHNGGPGNYTLTSSRMTVTAAGSDAGPLDYVGIEAIDFDVTSSTPGSADDVIRLHGKPAATTLNFHAGDGDDGFIVGNGDLDSNGWQLATLVGGNGLDGIIFNDELDTSSDGTSSAYTLAGQSLTKGTQVINYSGFESQSLKSANGFVSGFNSVPVVNLNATASIMQGTTIIGGAARGCTVNVGNGSFASLFGTFHVVLHGGFFDRMTASDSTAGGIANGYQVNDTFVRKNNTNQTINYSGVSQMTLSTSTVLDSVAIVSTPAGMILNVFSNGGNDLINLGDGDVGGTIRGPVAIDGGAGTDSLTIANVSDSLPSTQTLTATTFVDVNSHTYTAVEQLIINEGPGGTNLAVNSVSVPTTINGGAGDDSFTVGGGDIDANIPISTSAAPALIVNGGGGIDSIRFDDLNGPNVDSYIFQRTNGIDQLDKTDAGIHRWVSWGGIEAVTLDASNAPTPGTAMSGIVVSDIATALRINGNGGNDAVQIFDAQQPITVNTGLGGTDRMDVNFDFDALPLTVIVDQSDDIETLNVHAPAVLRITDGVVLAKTRLASLPADPNITGVLDLFGGAFLSRAGGATPAQFRSQIITGRNGGAWNGTGTGGAISSSLASLTPVSDGVGYGLGSEIAVVSIGPFAIAAGDTLVRYTLDGDADLDQRVNLNDFNRLASNFGSTGAVWTSGDFNYDGTANLNDFNVLAGNFGQGVAPQAFAAHHVRPAAGAGDERDLLEERN